MYTVTTTRAFEFLSDFLCHAIGASMEMLPARLINAEIALCTQTWEGEEILCFEKRSVVALPVYAITIWRVASHAIACVNMSADLPFRRRQALDAALFDRVHAFAIFVFAQYGLSYLLPVAPFVKMVSPFPIGEVTAVSSAIFGCISCCLGCILGS